jgi:hypothetical protein
MLNIPAHVEPSLALFQAIDAIFGTALNFIVNRTFQWIRGMPKLSAKIRQLKEAFPDFEGYDEFVEGCGSAMEALQAMSNNSDIVAARLCMTDSMFEVWQQAVALADSQDYTLEVVQCKVLNACVVDVVIDKSKVMHFSPALKLTAQRTSSEPQPPVIVIMR